MDINIIVQDSLTGKLFDIGELTEAITLETELTEQPGKLSFSLLDNLPTTLTLGSTVSLKINNQGVFFGYVFTISKKSAEEISVVAYDQLRYLKNKDTYILSGLTASQIFERVCKDFQLPYKVVDSSVYVVADRVNDNKTLFEIVNQAIDETLAFTGQWYMLKDNFGTLEFININSLKTTLFIGDESLLNSYTYQESIDDAYNQVKLVHENTETKKRELYIVNDSTNIKRWGTLQYFETVDESLNSAQIEERAKMLLNLKNRETRSLKVSCLGDLRITVGSGVILGVDELKGYGLNGARYFMVRKCTHKFSNNLHTMELELQVSL